MRRKPVIAPGRAAALPRRVRRSVLRLGRAAPRHARSRGKHRPVDAAPGTRRHHPAAGLGDRRRQRPGPGAAVPHADADPGAPRPRRRPPRPRRPTPTTRRPTTPTTTAEAPGTTSRPTPATRRRRARSGQAGESTGGAKTHAEPTAARPRSRRATTARATKAGRRPTARRAGHGATTDAARPARDAHAADADQPDASRSRSPAPPPIGVPNFFINKFRIPPFLLPIYQAAGIQYGVRWEVLAAINEIETDYGRNLNVSSAGALGWMQFMPSTWKHVRRRRQRRRREGPVQPGRRDLRRRALPEGRRRRQGHPRARSSPTTTPTGTSTRCSCARG